MFYYYLVLIQISVALCGNQCEPRAEEDECHLNHLLLMYDLNMFSKEEPEMERLIVTVQKCSKDIRDGVRYLEVRGAYFETEEKCNL